MPKKQKQAGFSLVEVMIIVGILGIVSATATVMIKNAMTSQALMRATVERDAIYDRISRQVLSPSTLEFTANSGNQTLGECLDIGVDPYPKDCVSIKFPGQPIRVYIGDPPIDAEHRFQIAGDGICYTLRGERREEAPSRTCPFAATVRFWTDCQGSASTCAVAEVIYFVVKVDMPNRNNLASDPQYGFAAAIKEKETVVNGQTSPLAFRAREFSFNVSSSCSGIANAVQIGVKPGGEPNCVCPPGYTGDPKVGCSPSSGINCMSSSRYMTGFSLDPNPSGPGAELNAKCLDKTKFCGIKPVDAYNCPRETTARNISCQPCGKGCATCQITECCGQ